MKKLTKPQVKQTFRREDFPDVGPVSTSSIDVRLTRVEAKLGVVSMCERCHERSADRVVRSWMVCSTCAPLLEKEYTR